MSNPESNLAHEPSNCIMRLATPEDVDGIVALLADDPLGKRRERPGDPAYAVAFAKISDDPNNELWVLEGTGGLVVGTMQLTFIPGLSRLGATRAQIESVRIAPSLQGKGVGTWIFDRLIERSRAKGANLVQLTSDKTRPDAHRFYERLGFVATHDGFKLSL